MVYLNLDKEFFEKNIKSMNQEAISELGDVDGKNMLTYSDNIIAKIEEIDGDIINVVMQHPKLGYISMEIKLDEDDYIKFIENINKKLNKFKTLLESLK